MSEIWSHMTPGRLVAAAVTSDGAVLGDENGLVQRLSLTGDTLGEHPLPAPIHDLHAAATGLLVVACGAGEVILLEEGRVLFRHSPGPAITMVFLGPHGDYILALSPEGEGIFLNRYGREMGRLSVPGGVIGATLVPRTGEVVTVSRGGEVQGFASWGKPLWRTDVGSSPCRPASDEAGELVLVPIMAYGVEALTVGGRSLGAYDIGEPVKSASCSGNGQILLFATTGDRLVLLQRDATVIASERFPSPVSDVLVAVDGSTALVTTSAGYAHLLALGMGVRSRPVEFTVPPSPPRTPWTLKRRVFSPFSLVVHPRTALSPDGSLVAIAGDRRRVEILTAEGESRATRRYGGSLLDLAFEPDGDLRVFSSASVFRFDPKTDDSIPEWAGEGDLAYLSRLPEGGAVGLTEAGEIVSFGLEPGRGRRLFATGAHDAAGLVALGGGVAVSRKSGMVDVFDLGGRLLASAGPWPAAPRLLAASRDGILLSVARLLVLLAPDGTETLRRSVSSPPDRGVALPGAFLFVDGAGDAHLVTPAGVIRRVFSAGPGLTLPFPDAGEGPGFLVTDGGLLTVVWPDGRPRFRFRAPDDFTAVSVSGNGRVAAAVAGCDLFLFPLVSPSGARPAAEASQYLEFADG